MKSVLLQVIRLDGGTQSRAALNESVVADYAEHLSSLPPVVLFHDGSDYWLADGFHRYHAFKKAGKVSITADVRTGTQREATLYSVGANKAHGLRRTNEDKRRAVTVLLNDAEWSQWSDRKIADECGVGHPFVAALRNPAVAEKQQQNRDTSAAKKARSVESDSTGKADGEAPAVESEPEAPVDYTELDKAQDQISELQSELVVARMGAVTEDDKQQAAELIAELRAEIKTLTATLASVNNSRDSLMEENSQMKTQMQMQRKEIAKLKNSN